MAMYRLLRPLFFCVLALLATTQYGQSEEQRAVSGKNDQSAIGRPQLPSETTRQAGPAIRSPLFRPPQAMRRSAVTAPSRAPFNGPVKTSPGQLVSGRTQQGTVGINGTGFKQAGTGPAVIGGPAKTTSGVNGANIRTRR